MRLFHSSPFVILLEGDSLSLVELLLAVVDALGKTIPDGEIGKMATVQDLVDYCQN